MAGFTVLAHTAAVNTHISYQQDLPLSIALLMKLPSAAFMIWAYLLTYILSFPYISCSQPPGVSTRAARDYPRHCPHPPQSLTTTPTRNTHAIPLMHVNKHQLIYYRTLTQGFLSHPSMPLPHPGLLLPRPHIDKVMLKYDLYNHLSSLPFLPSKCWVWLR